MGTMRANLELLEQQSMARVVDLVKHHPRVNLMFHVEPTTDVLRILSVHNSCVSRLAWPLLISMYNCPGP